MFDYIFIFILLNCFIAFFSAPTILAYFIYRYLKSKGWKIIGVVVFILILTYNIYYVYTAFYPEDRFYKGEFKRITGFELSDNAKVIKADASYPDFHGDYCSNALIQLSSEEYKEILKRTLDDKRFQNSEISDCRPTSEVISEYYPNIDVGLLRYDKMKDNCFIGFLDEEESIIIMIIVT